MVGNIEDSTPETKRGDLEIEEHSYMAKGWR